MSLPGTCSKEGLCGLQSQLNVQSALVTVRDTCSGSFGNRKDPFASVIRESVCFLGTSRKWCKAWKLVDDGAQNPPSDVQGIRSHSRLRGS